MRDVENPECMQSAVVARRSLVENGFAFALTRSRFHAQCYLPVVAAICRSNSPRFQFARSAAAS